MVSKREGKTEPEAIWDYIKYLRKSCGHSLIAFARLIDCSHVHAARIERPYQLTHNTASIKLLKKIAGVCARDAEERDRLEKKLLMKRARIFFANDIVEDAYNQLITPDFQLHEERMPKEFIERLREDTRNLKEDTIAKRLSISKEALVFVLEGRLTLSRHKVSELAKKLNQPEEEYLLLAGYVPEGLKRLFLNKHFLYLIIKSAELTSDEMEKLGIALNNMLSLIIKNVDKKKEGG